MNHLKSIAGLAKAMKIKVYQITNLFKDKKITKKDCTIIDGKVWLNRETVKKIKLLLSLNGNKIKASKD